MTKTASDVIAMAHRRLALLSVDEVPSADQGAFARDTLEGVLLDLTTVQGATITWTVDTVPDDAFLPMAYLLATEIAPHYEVPSEPRSRAMGRMRAYLFPDDRDDAADLDEDGSVTDEEQDAYDRAAYY